MSVMHSILVRLSDGKAHSLGELESALALDAPALRARLEGLMAWAPDMAWSGDRVQWRSPRPLLSLSEIRTRLGADCPEIELYASVDSTNQRLRERFAPGKLCIAEHQRAGRGRRGRAWASPAFANVYLSMGWRFEGDPMAIAGLSLAVGVVVAEALQPLCSRAIGLKWPNDLYVDGRKLGGVLIETVARGETLDAIIGVGVNVLMEQAPPEVDQPWTALARHGGETDRNRVVAAVAGALVRLCRAGPQRIAPLLETAWPSRDLSLGRAVALLTDGVRHEGRGAGVDAQGRFLLATSEGVRRFPAGEVSLRLAAS